MKKIALSTIMLAALAVVACNKNEETITASPELELADSAMTVVAAGGPQTVSYTLTDPAEDGQVSASALEGCDWISGFDTSEDGEVAFEVAANEDETSREGGLTVTYTWSGGELTRTLAVTQEGKEPEQPEPGEEPEIRPAQDRYEVEAAGGQLEILYEIVNPVEDGVFSASLDPDCGWISDLNTDTDGVVTLTVAENTDQTGRESVMTLSYSDITEDVTVYQSGAQSAEDPSDIETENGYLTFSFAGEATDAAEIHYTIVNPKAGAYMRVVADSDWISGVDCSQEGIVTFSLSENTTGAERSASFSLRYTTDVSGVGAVDLCRKDLTVKQLPKVEQGEVTDNVKFTFSAVRTSVGGVSITVKADNNTSFFLADTRFASQVEGRTWYDIAYEELQSSTAWINMMGIEGYCSRGEWTLNMTPSDWDQYIFAFAIDEDLNITSEVQYMHLEDALNSGGEPGGGDEPSDVKIGIEVLDCPNAGNVTVAFTADDYVSYGYSVFPKSDFAEEADLEAAMTKTISSYLGDMYGMYYNMFGETTAWNTVTDTGSGEANISYSSGSDPDNDYYVVAIPASKDGAVLSVYGQVSYAEFHYPLQ